MFFCSKNISVEIISVFELSWKSRDDIPEKRSHPMLSFRKKGNAEIKYEGGSFFVGTGEIMYVPANCEYRIQSGYEELIVIHFQSDATLPHEIKIFKSDSPAYLKNKFESIYSSWSKKLPGYEYECKSSVYKILSVVEREYSGTKGTDASDKIFKVVEYIHENFLDRDLTIEKLAKMCSVSDTYFRKIFFRKFSVTPLKYINNLKLEYAMELLHSKYYTVGEVAHKCGFDNVYYFSNFIKKETGVSPLEHIDNRTK